MLSLDKAPHAPSRIRFAQLAPRCGACTRQGFACRSPAMPNGRCRMHGGASTGAQTPEGRERARRAPLIHGRRSAEHIALRQGMRAAVVQLRDMVRAADAEMRAEARLHREMLRRFGR